MSPLKLKLKPLLSNLTFVYLEDNKTLPIMISNTLTLKQKDKLVRVHREHSEALEDTNTETKDIFEKVVRLDRKD